MARIWYRSPPNGTHFQFPLSLRVIVWIYYIFLGCLALGLGLKHLIPQQHCNQRRCDTWFRDPTAHWTSCRLCDLNEVDFSAWYRVPFWGFVAVWCRVTMDDHGTTQQQYMTLDIFESRDIQMGTQTGQREPAGQHPPLMHSAQINRGGPQIMVTLSNEPLSLSANSFAWAIFLCVRF